jgi:peptidyl-tRNA hydrolase, PTH2 family
MVDIKQASDYMLEGHQITCDDKNFYFYDYNKPEEEFNLTLNEIRSNKWKISKKNFVPIKPNYIMYVFANKNIKMSPGKLASQVAHGACFAQLHSNNDIIKQWINKGFTKIILQVKDEYELKEIKNQLLKLGIQSTLITDEGRTEIPSGSITALGVEVIDKNKYIEFFQKFKLYKNESFLDKIKKMFKKFRKNKDEYK